MKIKLFVFALLTILLVGCTTSNLNFYSKIPNAPQNTRYYRADFNLERYIWESFHTTTNRVYEVK